MNKLFLSIFTLATASFSPVQAMMLSSAVRLIARPALPQVQRPALPAPQRHTAPPAMPKMPLLQPQNFQRTHALQAHAFSTNSHNNAGNNQRSQSFKPKQAAQKSSSWFGYLVGATAAAGIGYDLFGDAEEDKLIRSLRLNSLDGQELDEIAQTEALLTYAKLKNPKTIVRLTKSWRKILFLEKLMATNPQTAATVTTTITQNPDVLAKIATDFYGRQLLEKLMTRNPQTAAAIANAVAQNPDTISVLATGWRGSRQLLETLMTTNPQTAAAIANAVAQNPDTISNLANDSDGRQFLEKLMATNPQTAATVTTTITQNPDALGKIATDFYGRQFLKKLMATNPQTAAAIANAVAQNPDALAKIATDSDGRQFLEKLMATNPRFAQQLSDLMLKNLDKLLCLVPILWKNNPDLKKTLLQRIKEEACKGNDYENFAKMIKLFQLCMETPTQTGQHLQSNLEHTFNSETVQYYLQEEHLNTLHHKVVKKEKELQHAGYFTFVHGQQRAYYLPEMLYTHLWQIFNNQQTEEFMFAHVKTPTTDKQREERKLQKLRQNGRHSNSDRQRLLFLNYAFFGNDINPDSNSAVYLVINNNASSISISPEDACSHFNCTDIYEAHKKELNALDQEYRNLSSEGTLLLIGIPHDKVNDMVYSALPGGYKQNIHLKGIGETDNTQLILQTLRDNPEKIGDTDLIEFCLIMTQKDGGLDPETGIKVIPFIPGNEQKLQELERRREDLFARIRKSVEEKTQQA